MNRSDFLRKLGIGVGVAVVAPKVIANNKIPINDNTESLDLLYHPSELDDSNNQGWYSRTFQSYMDRETGGTIYAGKIARYVINDAFENKKNKMVYIVKEIEYFAGIPMYGITSNNVLITFKTETQLDKDFLHLGNGFARFDD